MFGAERDGGARHVTGMGISVNYPVADITISSCFQFFSNKNIGNVMLFALQIKRLDSLFNICINFKYYKASVPINQAVPSARSPGSGPFLSVWPRRRFPNSPPGSLCPYFMAACPRQDGHVFAPQGPTFWANAPPAPVLCSI